MSKRKNVYRLPPCPLYDAACMERWLTDMAAAGLHLDADDPFPFLVGPARFVRGKPEAVRYRMDAQPKPKGFLFDTVPDEEQLALAKSLGWTYVFTRGGFSCYRSDCPGAPELHTDRAVQAYSVKKLEQAMRPNWFLLFYWLLLYPLMLFKTPLRNLIRMGSWLLLPLFAVVALSLGVSIRQAICLRKMRKGLETGINPTQNTDWKRSARWYRLQKLAVAATLVTMFVLAAFRVCGDRASLPDRRKPLEDFPGPVPFATLETLIFDGSYAQSPAFDRHSNSFARWSDLLAPVAIRWSEEGVVRLPDETDYRIQLHLDYYQARWPFVARLLAEECSGSEWDSGLSILIRKWKRQNHPPEQFPLEVDYAAAFFDPFPGVVLQKGSTVIRATFYTWNYHESSLPAFSQLQLAEGLASRIP